MNDLVKSVKPKVDAAKMQLVRIGQDVRESPQKILYAGIGALAGVIAIKQLSNIFSKTADEKNADALNNGINQEIKKGNKLTYLDTQYNQLADMIEQATDTAGTDENTIYGVFQKMKNNADVLQLIKAYGKRYNFWFGIPLGKFDLTQILVSELSRNERRKVNDILAKKGITITF